MPFSALVYIWIYSMAFSNSIKRCNALHFLTEKSEMKKTLLLLVGGFNPYARQIGSFLQGSGWSLNNWNHHLVFHQETCRVSSNSFSVDSQWLNSWVFQHLFQVGGKRWPSRVARNEPRFVVAPVVSWYGDMDQPKKSCNTSWLNHWSIPKLWNDCYWTIILFAVVCLSSILKHLHFWVPLWVLRAVKWRNSPQIYQLKKTEGLCGPSRLCHVVVANLSTKANSKTNRNWSVVFPSSCFFVFTPPKINMEPKNGGLEDVLSFSQGGIFRFHVGFPGCILFGWLQGKEIWSTEFSKETPPTWPWNSDFIHVENWSFVDGMGVWIFVGGKDNGYLGPGPKGSNFLPKDWRQITIPYGKKMASPLEGAGTKAMMMLWENVDKNHFKSQISWRKIPSLKLTAKALEKWM